MAVDRTRYDFNGKVRLTKKALMKELINKFLQQNKLDSLEKLKSMFPQKSDFNVDMFVDHQTYNNFNHDRKGRYFEQPFVLSNNEKVYLSNQWGGDVFQKLIKDFKNANYDIQEHLRTQKNQGKQNTIDIKNIILYGPPGVGKTHNINKLISLIEEGKNTQEIFQAIEQNEKFEHISLDDIKKRVKFVTFHQSFGYEDFIEGFRPNEKGKIELEDGVFKIIANEAEENLKNSSSNDFISFKKAFDILFKEKIENGESVKIELKRNGSYFNVTDFNNKTIYFEKQSGTTKHTLSIASLERMYNEETNKFINGGLAIYYNPILDKLLEIKRNSPVTNVEKKNYYLVIDEINRGNISKIFGELITLIEEDKRDKLEVTLPYSKEPFKVPSNLYIIGTMNSTDKSIALIDIALRRRFTFLKMEPNAALIDDVEAKRIFTELNEYIEDKLGAEYQIGHSYFMGDKIDLDFVMVYKIKPLLEEYFYGDKEGLDEALRIVGE